MTSAATDARADGGRRPPAPARWKLAVTLGTALVLLAGCTLVYLTVADPSWARREVSARNSLPGPSGPGDPGASETNSAGPSASASASATARASGSAGPSPAPIRAGPCPAFPRFPDAGCTGWQHTGVKLRTCANVVTQSNVTLDGCRFIDNLTVRGANVKITRSRVEGRVIGVNLNLNGLKLIDVEIDGGGNADANQAAIGNDNYTCTRCHVHGTGRGANLGDNVWIEDSYLHDWAYSEGAHQTAIGSNGGGNYTIRHNNLSCASGGCSAAFSLYGDFAPINGALVEKNLFNTNGSYCTYAGSVSGKPYPHGTNIRYVDNLFGKVYFPQCGIYGPVATWEANAGNIWTGNRWQDGSGLVQPKSGT